MYVPIVIYKLLGFCWVDVFPSPKSQFHEIGVPDDKSVKLVAVPKHVDEFENAPKVSVTKKKKEPVRAQTEKPDVIVTSSANTSTVAKIKDLQRDVDLLLEGL